MEYQAIDWYATDVLDDETQELQYIIKSFGKTSTGCSISVSITGYKPNFFIKIEEKWSSNDSMKKLQMFLIKLLQNVNIQLAERKDFWGFTNNKVFNFFKLEFASEKAMRSAIFKLDKMHKISPLTSTPYKFRMYETNIEPYIRMMHMRRITPSGWIKISKYYENDDQLLTCNNIDDIECDWKSLQAVSKNQIANFLVASFDIECSSYSGDFPQAIKSYIHLSNQLIDIYNGNIDDTDYNLKECIINAISFAYGVSAELVHQELTISRIEPKHKINVELFTENLIMHIDDICAILRKKKAKETKALELDAKFTGYDWMPEIKGDNIIQIGTTFHYYGSKICHSKNIITLGTCDNIENVEVVECKTEDAMLLTWRDLIVSTDPDIITGYNIVGFDFNYMYERAQELGILHKFMLISRFKNFECKFKEQKLSSSALGDNILKYVDMPGRVIIDVMKVVQRDHKLDSYKLDNVAEHFTGQRKNDITPKDIFRLQLGNSRDRSKIAKYCIQDCELCNHLIIKLEIIANNIGMSNVCIVPFAYIFTRGQGIKIYSLVLNECHLEKFAIPTIKKKISVRNDSVTSILAEKELSNTTLSNIEKHIKLIEKQLSNDTRLDGTTYSNIASSIILYACNKELNSSEEITIVDTKKVYPYSKQNDINKVTQLIIENLNDCVEGDDDTFEGAIVLDPVQGIYIDKPVAVMDYASLYPSSMISENLSHDMIVIDPKYDNLPEVDYLDIEYDVYEKGTKNKIDVRRCRYVQPKNGEKGIIPRILQKLLMARKTTRKKIAYKRYKDHIGMYNAKDKYLIDELTNDKIQVEHEDELQNAYNEFEVAMLDGLQNAYKITANSLYGQIGASTSQIYLKDIAACTTATGRKMIMLAKEHLEKNYNANIVYGDTDSIFITFPDVKETKHAAIKPSIDIAMEASKTIKSLLKHPHDLEYEKTFWPFILLSKKRYVGNLYQFDDVSYSQKSMGIVLKRRDNANIVKHIYGGIVNLILSKQDISGSIDFMDDALRKLIRGEFDLSQLVISKTLRSEYKDPTRIAHKVLAERIGLRDPGNKPQINDRIPYVYIRNDNPNALQGDRIETPDYIKEMKIQPDYSFYITNQIMKPILQIYSLVIEELPGYAKFPKTYLKNIEDNIFSHTNDFVKTKEKLETIKDVIVKQLLFDPILKDIPNVKIKKSLLIKRYTLNIDIASN